MTVPQVRKRRVQYAISFHAGDSEARFLDLYGSLDARDEMMIDLLHVTIENGVVTEISMGRYE